MANEFLSTTYNATGVIAGGFSIKGNPCSTSIFGIARGASTVVYGNSPAVPIFVPYGQTWPR